MSERITARDIAYIRKDHKRNRIGNCTNDRDRWPCQDLRMANEIAVLRSELEMERHLAECRQCRMGGSVPRCSDGTAIQEALTAAREAEAAVPS